MWPRRGANRPIGFATSWPIRGSRVEGPLSSVFSGIAEPVTDPGRVADFLEYRLRRHPKMVGAIMRREGLPRDLEPGRPRKLRGRRAMVIVRLSSRDQPSGANRSTGFWSGSKTVA